MPSDSPECSPTIRSFSRTIVNESGSPVWNDGESLLNSKPLWKSSAECQADKAADVLAPAGHGSRDQNSAIDEDELLKCRAARTECPELVAHVRHLETLPKPEMVARSHAKTRPTEAQVEANLAVEAAVSAENMNLPMRGACKSRASLPPEIQEQETKERELNAERLKLLR